MEKNIQRKLDKRLEDIQVALERRKLVEEQKKKKIEESSALKMDISPGRRASLSAW